MLAQPTPTSKIKNKILSSESINLKRCFRCGGEIHFDPSSKALHESGLCVK